MKRDDMMSDTEEQRTWIDFAEEVVQGDYVKFEDGDEKEIKVVTNPVFGDIEFPNPDGTTNVREGIQMEVLVGDSAKIMKWSITAKGLMSQLMAICRREGLGADLKGATLRVNATGMNKQRKYFIKILEKPNKA